MSQETSYPKVNIVDENGNVINSSNNGNGNASGTASDTNQQTQIQLETQTLSKVSQLSDRLPSTLSSDRLKVEVDNGTPITGATMPTGGVGWFGWLSAIWKLVSDRLPVLTSGKIPVATDSLLEGTDITGTSIPAGGTSGRGWLSAIWKLVSDRTTTMLSTLALDTSLQSILAAIPSTSKPALVRNISNKFREDFATFSPSVWQTIQIGSGQSISSVSSELRIASGTVINSETIIRSLVGFTIPMRVTFTFYISQRIINQEIYFEITDSAGSNIARMQFTSTGNSSVNVQTINNGSSLGATSLIINGTASYGIIETELNIDEIDFYSRVVDSTSSRGSVGATRTRFLPDPNQIYYLQIRCKNLATSPASSTTLFIDSISCQDIEEFSVEVSGGRGGSNPSQAIPVIFPVAQAVNIISAPLISIVNSSGSQIIESTTLLAAGATFTGTSRNTVLLRNLILGWVVTDQPGILYIDQSTDNATWRQVYSLNVSSSANATLYECKIYAQFYRLRFTNTGIATQTAMQLISNTVN